MPPNRSKDRQADHHAGLPTLRGFFFTLVGGARVLDLVGSKADPGELFVGVLIRAPPQKIERQVV